MISRWARLRILLCGALLALGALRVGRRAVQLQVEEQDELRARAEEQHLRDIELRPQRGRILDRKGVELAGTAQFDSVACNPRQLLTVSQGPERLARALKLDPRQLRRSIEAVRTRYFTWVKRTVTPEESARVAALGLRGVSFRREPKRIYPRSEVGATVIGHANIDGKGVEGVEKAFEAALRGKSTRLAGMKDGSGRELLMEGLADHNSGAGRDVVLAVDEYLTYVTQTALASAVKQWNAKGGVSIIMDPQTGDILSMVSVPTYDPNAPSEAVGKGFSRNRAITDILEPGSTLKTFTMAATLDAGRVRPEDMFDCQAGRPLMIGKTRIRDSHPEGVLTAAAVYQRSSNIGTVKIARQLGKQKLYEALVRFGFGRRTGVGLAGEVPGILLPLPKWGEVHFANIAFGQGLAVTPLQMVTAYAAIANRGIYRAPRLALRTVGPDGRDEPFAAPASARPEQRVISETTADIMLEMMHGVTGAQGTATQAAIDGYAVAGKTGTAQKVVNGRYSESAWVGSFIGIVPVDRPRLVIAVFIDEPQPEHRGGMVAAPTFKKIAQAALQYLAVPPTELVASAGTRKGLPILAIAGGAKPADPSLAPAAAGEIVELGEGPGSDQPLWVGPEDMNEAVALGDEVDEPALASEELGGALAAGRAPADDEDGSEAVAGDPAPASRIVAVPSFLGMSIGEAIRAARDAGLEIALEGSGVAVTQSPPPGALPRGGLCRISFRPGG